MYIVPRRFVQRDSNIFLLDVRTISGSQPDFREQFRINNRDLKNLSILRILRSLRLPRFFSKFPDDTQVGCNLFGSVL